MRPSGRRRSIRWLYCPLEGFEGDSGCQSLTSLSAWTVMDSCSLLCNPSLRHGGISLFPNRCPLRSGMIRLGGARSLVWGRRVRRPREGSVGEKLDEGLNLRPPEDGFERSEEHTSELQSRQYLVCRL